MMKPALSPPQRLSSNAHKGAETYICLSCLTPEDYAEEPVTRLDSHALWLQYFRVLDLLVDKLTLGPGLSKQYSTLSASSFGSTL